MFEIDLFYSDVYYMFPGVVLVSISIGGGQRKSRKKIVRPFSREKFERQSSGKNVQSPHELMQEFVMGGRQKKTKHFLHERGFSEKDSFRKFPSPADH